MRLVQINENQFINPDYIIFIDRVISGGLRFNMILVDGKKYSSPNFSDDAAAFQWLANLQTTAKWKPQMAEG